MNGASFSTAPRRFIEVRGSASVSVPGARPFCTELSRAVRSSSELPTWSIEQPERHNSKGTEQFYARQAEQKAAYSGFNECKHMLTARAPLNAFT
eukprot:2436247-Alexandrium_andersonii.AAC.1